MTLLNASPSDRWFRRPLAPATGRLRLLCFPPAGSGANFYRQWSHLMPAAIEVLAVQYPGREDRIAEPLCESLASLVDGIAQAAMTLREKPLALFGHSMGAAVAHETAKRLEAAGIRIEHLFVSGRPPPHRQRSKAIHRRDDDGVLAEIARLGGTPSAVLENAELRALLLPSIRADFHLIETYEGGLVPALRAPVSAFIGTADTEVGQQEAVQWADVTGGAFDLTCYEGGHFYLVDRPAPLIRALTAKLSAMAWPCTP